MSQPGPGGYSEDVHVSNGEMDVHFDVNNLRRFVPISEEDTANFSIDNRNGNTVRKTEGNVRIRTTWLKECNEVRTIDEIPPNELNTYLRYFLSVRKYDGTAYDPDSLRE